jgi:UTP-glucose-1-phosphate uridylyltransferase
MAKSALVIMAAGMGSRYGGLKQIDPVGPNGEIIMDYSVYDALRAGFDKLVFVIRRDIEDVFKQTIGKKFEDKIQVNYVNQDMDACLNGFPVPSDRKKPWGTGHAILVTNQLIDGPFAVINADDYYGAGSFKMMAEYLGSEADNYAMVGYILRNTLSEHGHVSRGVCQCDDNMFLKTVVERTKIEKQGQRAVSIDKGAELSMSGDEIVSMNFWGFHPSLFKALKIQFAEFLKTRGNEAGAEFYIPAVIDKMISAKQVKVKVLKTKDKWFGITYPEDKAAAVNSIKALIDQGLYPSKLW